MAGRIYAFAFYCASARRFTRGTLDHGTTDDYFFLIISLLGRPVINRYGGKKCGIRECFWFFYFVCMDQGMRERERDDDHGMERERGG